jgi:Ser-tRNA(Ala) deacylase AlaX
MHPLYMEDSYLKEFTATIKETADGAVVLDNTAFFPAGGGVPCDMGTIEKDGQTFIVNNVTKDTGRILHHISGTLAAGDSVRCAIDWPRRYTLMRQHTAAHLLAAIMYNDLGLLITGNQLDVDKSRMDFSMENFDKAVIEGVVEKANAAIKRNPAVKTYFLRREDAIKIPGIVKLAGALPPSVDELRIVEIEGMDIQADGGCHVHSLSEIGVIEFLKADNKGKSNRRIYYTVK